MQFKPKCNKQKPQPLEQKEANNDDKSFQTRVTEHHHQGQGQPTRINVVDQGAGCMVLGIPIAPSELCSMADRRAKLRLTQKQDQDQDLATGTTRKRQNTTTKTKQINRLSFYLRSAKKVLENKKK